MTRLSGSGLFAGVAAFAVICCNAQTAAASWITIKNNTKQMVTVQETKTVNGQLKRCKPVTLLPGETLREFLEGPGVKKLDVFDGHNPRRSLWSGNLSCQEKSQTFSIVDSGGAIVVRPVGGIPPRTERK